MPSRKVRKAGQAGKPAGGYNGPAADEDDEPAAPFDPDALLPRIDISSQITSKLVANMGSANWKERNAALDEVEEIIKAAGGRIQPSVGDLMSALKVSCSLSCCCFTGSVQVKCKTIGFCYAACTA
jgi:hypothetical protein